jgi:4a-hydroxytetrahydrobiopterin dehydratase
MGRELATERCMPCEQGTPPLQLEDALGLLRETDGKWHLSDDHRALTRQITFMTFGRAMAFLNRLAEIAEREGHHPDFCLLRWNQVSLSLTTHAISGLFATNIGSAEEPILVAIHKIEPALLRA